VTNKLARLEKIQWTLKDPIAREQIVANQQQKMFRNKHHFQQKKQTITWHLEMEGLIRPEHLVGIALLLMVNVHQAILMKRIWTCQN
jgi:hypothetical protein